MLANTAPLALRAAHPPRPRRVGWFSLLAALLCASLLRALPLADNRFHPDEALYASFARLIASGQDVLLAGRMVDKPPLTFYLNAGSVLLLGGSEIALRLPNYYASVVSVALLYAVTRRLHDRATGHLAAWVLALSPLAILFSITLFVDPLLVALALWATWLVLRQRWGWAGLALALGFATKQTALLVVPLTLGLALMGLPSNARPREALRRALAVLGPMLLGLLVALLALAAWEAARQATIGYWQQGYADNMPGRLIRGNEVLPRARAWLELLHYFTASRPVNWLFMTGLPVWLARNLLRPSRAAAVDLLLAAYLLLYLGAYWLLAFNVWDRYLLLVLPWAAVLLARVLRLAGAALAERAQRLIRGGWTWRARSQEAASGLIPVLVLALLLPSAFTASRSGYPVGGDHGAYDGIEDAAAYLHGLGRGGVVYDHWLSWQWNYYLFDGPLYISWFPTPDALATDLRSFGRTSDRYLVVPAWESEAEVRAAVAEAGFGMHVRHETYRRDGSRSFTIYQLVPSER